MKTSIHLAQNYHRRFIYFNFKSIVLSRSLVLYSSYAKMIFGITCVTCVIDFKFRGKICLKYKEKQKLKYIHKQSLIITKTCKISIFHPLTTRITLLQTCSTADLRNSNGTLAHGHECCTYPKVARHDHRRYYDTQWLCLMLIIPLTH